VQNLKKVRTATAPAVRTVGASMLLVPVNFLYTFILQVSRKKKAHVGSEIVPKAPEPHRCHFHFFAAHRTVASPTWTQ
jgi:hypothetical protein